MLRIGTRKPLDRVLARRRRISSANAAVGRDDEAQYVTEEYLAELEAEMMAAAEALEGRTFTALYSSDPSVLKVFSI